MSRSLWLPLLVLVGCAGKRAVKAPEPDDDTAGEDIEIHVKDVGIGEPCTAVTCATPHATLSLRSGARASKVRLLRVSIVGHGRSLDLAARAPTVWTSVGAYEPWNEMIGADEVMDIQYDLARVDWDHFDSPLAVHPVAVVVEVDGRERVFSITTRELFNDDDFTTN